MSIQSFGNAYLKDIKTFEFNNDIELPKDYVNFLLRYNGGNIELNDDNTFHVDDLGEDINIDVVFGINTKESELSVEFWTNKYKNEMPQGTIIIGDSYQHGFIILMCFGEDAGVYYWDDTFEFPCSSDEANTYFIADTFTDFIKHLLN